MIRANEEVQQSKDEMMCCLQWYAQEHGKLTRLVSRAQSKGKLVGLLRKQMATAKAFQRANILFSKHLQQDITPRLDTEDVLPLGETADEVILEDDFDVDSEYEEDDDL